MGFRQAKVVAEARRSLTDAEGRFELNGLSESGTFVVSAQWPLGGGTRVKDVKAGATVDLVLQALGSLSGTAVDAKGQPVEHLIMQLLNEQTGQQRNDVVFAPGGKWQLERTSLPDRCRSSPTIRPVTWRWRTGRWPRSRRSATFAWHWPPSRPRWPRAVLRSTRRSRSAGSARCRATGRLASATLSGPLSHMPLASERPFLSRRAARPLAQPFHPARDHRFGHRTALPCELLAAAQRNHRGDRADLEAPAVCCAASVSTLAKSALPAWARAAASNWGAIIRQGPHHAAQKSMMTGRSELST